MNIYKEIHLKDLIYANDFDVKVIQLLKAFNETNGLVDFGPRDEDFKPKDVVKQIKEMGYKVGIQYTAIVHSVDNNVLRDGAYVATEYYFKDLSKWKISGPCATTECMVNGTVMMNVPKKFINIAKIIADDKMVAFCSLYGDGQSELDIDISYKVISRLLIERPSLKICDCDDKIPSGTPYILSNRENVSALYRLSEEDGHLIPHADPQFFNKITDIILNETDNRE